MHQEFPLSPAPSIPPTLLPGCGKFGAHLPPAVSLALGVRGYPRTVRSRSAAPRPRRRPRHRARVTLRGSRIQPCQIPAALPLPPVSSSPTGRGLELLAPAPRGPTPPPPHPSSVGRGSSPARPPGTSPHHPTAKPPPPPPPPPRRLPALPSPPPFAMWQLPYSPTQKVHVPPRMCDSS